MIFKWHYQCVVSEVFKGHLRTLCSALDLGSLNHEFKSQPHKNVILIFHQCRVDLYMKLISLMYYMHVLYHTGCFTSDCAKVKACIAKKYWLKILIKGTKPFSGCGHLWKCEANLSISIISRGMVCFSLKHIANSDLYL